MVTVYLNESEIARHRFLHGIPGQYSTSVQHMLPPHEAVSKDWTLGQVQNWASSVGSSTLKVINYYLQRGTVPQQGFKIAMSLLSLSKTCSYRQLEKACSYELANNVWRPSFRKP